MTRLKNSMGFSAVEILLIIVVVGTLGFAGWFVYRSHTTAGKDNNSQQTTHASSAKKTSEPADPYAGWESYTTTYDKLKFKYPADWQLSDTSNAGNSDVTPGQDWVRLTSNDSLEVSIILGTTDFDGGSPNVRSLYSTPVSMLGGAYYLQFTSSSDTTAGAVVTTSNSLPRTSSFPAAKNIRLSQATLSNPAIQDMPAPFDLISVQHKDALSYPVSKFLQDPNYKTAIAILESMSY
jgi:hypothetical protein